MEASKLLRGVGIVHNTRLTSLPQNHEKWRETIILFDGASTIESRYSFGSDQITLLVLIFVRERPMGNIRESMGIVRAEAAEATRAERNAR